MNVQRESIDECVNLGALGYGKEISFTHENHAYLDKDGNKFVSVSTIKSSLTEPFDTYKIADYVSRRDGVPAIEIIEKWNKKAIEGRDWGTALHKQIEDLLCKKTTNEIFLKKSEVVPIVKKINEFCNSKGMPYDEYGMVEIRVAEPVSKIAGTIDLLLVDFINKKFMIIDYKTDSDLFDKECKKKGYLRKPFQNLKNNAFSVYTVQMRLYAGILVEAGFEPIENNICAYIFSIPKNDYKNVNIYPVEANPLTVSQMSMCVDYAKKYISEDSYNNMKKIYESNFVTLSDDLIGDYFESGIKFPTENKLNKLKLFHHEIGAFIKSMKSNIDIS